MKIDSELRNIVMGDLTSHLHCVLYQNQSFGGPSCQSWSEIHNPRQALGFLHVNDLLSKFDSVANIIWYRSLLPTFLETRTMLLMEEQRMSSPRLVQLTIPPCLLFCASEIILQTGQMPVVKIAASRSNAFVSIPQPAAPTNQPTKLAYQNIFNTMLLNDPNANYS